MADPEGDDYRQLSTDGAPYTWVASPSLGRNLAVLLPLSSLCKFHISKHPKSSSYRVSESCLPEEKVMILLIIGKQKT